jgi:peptidoglycan hydrolase CwlO-like protein
MKIIFNFQFSIFSKNPIYKFQLSNLFCRKGFLSVTLFLFLIFSLFTIRQPLFTASAVPDCDNPGFGDIDFCIARIEQEISALRPAQEYNKRELADLRVQIKSLETRVAAISVQLVKKEEDIREREEDLAYAEEIFSVKTKNHYIFVRLYDPLVPFLSSNDASTAFREIALRQKAANQDIRTMEGYAEDLIALKNDKDSLEKNQASLSSFKAQVSSRASFLAEEVEKTEDYLTALSAKQQELAALKAGGFQTSVGDTPATLDPCSGPPGSSTYCDPGFRPAFAFFSFGAPHRAGMSQYGAYGRAKEGQSAEEILSAYYQGASLNKGYSVPDTIGVVGHGRISFEDNYLLGIYEVPESWGNSGGYEALKAQAVAARSYALAVTNNGSGTICTTESCQVYKSQLKSGRWADAVRETRGWVMVRDGAPATTYYASTSGGFTLNKWGWTGIKDAKNGNWPGDAYERIAGSPWFYKGWYKSRAGASCGRSHPWLTSTEVADIINAWEVLHNGASGDRSRISPINTNCWGGNPYSISELASIGGHTGVSSVSVVYGNDGQTLSVTFTTNKGTRNIPGWQLSDGKEGAVNLRAPGYIGLKSSLFNVEKL